LVGATLKKRWGAIVDVDSHEELRTMMSQYLLNQYADIGVTPIVAFKNTFT
jgi:muconolactone delta-isomerase